MRSPVPRLLLLLPCACALALAAAAPAAAAKASYPTITSVSPRTLGIGDVMTIRGHNFRKGKNHNVVVLKRDGGRAVFVQAPVASTTKLSVTVPAKLLPFLTQKSGQPVSTRFRVRILARRFGRSFTSRALSPTIGPAAITPAAANCDGDSLPNAVDTDDDNDGLPDVLEAQVGTDPCKADTDGDGVSDPFEYYSALDLNNRNLPYPGKRPYPNPLDGSDANLDFDQDGMTMSEEYRAWGYTGAPFPLSYSDGTKYSGGKVSVTGPTASLDLDGNGYLSDDEKDVDGDGLGNWDEAHGRMTQAWWTAQYDGTNDVKESPYPGPAYVDTSFVDPDTDGDGLPDGADDQDHDGYTNLFEISRPGNWKTTYVSTAHSGGVSPNPLARVQPFNPCKPIYSDACHTHPPFAYYDATEDWASPLHPGDPGT
jgi:hypothetical protein